MTTPKPAPKPAKPRKKSKWIVLGAVGLFGLGGIGSYVVNSDSSGSSQQPGRNVSGAGKIGTTVRDGTFEFVVRSVQCGVGQIGPDYAGERAQGQFCLVSLTVKNIGDQAQTMTDDVQSGYGSDGAQYGTNPTAGIYANEPNNQVWPAEIDPGGEVTGTIVYDLPHGVELAQLELHDSPASAGVMIDLR